MLFFFLFVSYQAVIRSQELEFIRMSRRDNEPPNLVATMHRLFQEELIHRRQDGELPIFTVTSGVAYNPLKPHGAHPHQGTHTQVEAKETNAK